ncbi:MAG: LacI family DNA-binding transcriptional regulator [Hyphomicrobiaceae bacterium]|nr:LacI family DNA-binding transcriptional regulator [Hyphomicrobiaceae bacterium]
MDDRPARHRLKIDTRGRTRTSRPGKTVDLKFLAELLGVSKGTVSRALNDYPEISEETRRRVKQAAEQHGYRPNRAARRLSTGRSDTIGFVPLQDAVPDFQPAFLRGLTTTMTKAGGDLILSPASDLQTACSIIDRMVLDGRVDGLIIHDPLPDDPRLDYMQKRGLTYVTLGRTDFADPAPYVFIDDAVATRSLIGALRELGHERFAFFAGHGDSFAVRQRCEGLRSACSASGSAFEEAFLSGDKDAAAEQFLKMTKATAVLCDCDLTALALIAAAHRIGLRVPQDLTVIGHGNSSFAAHTLPGLSTIGWSDEQVGARLARLLLDAVADPVAAPTRLRVPAEFIARGSHGPAPRG